MRLQVLRSHRRSHGRRLYLELDIFQKPRLNLMELIPSTPPGQTQCPANSNGLGEGWDIFGTLGFEHAESEQDVNMQPHTQPLQRVRTLSKLMSGESGSWEAGIVHVSCLLIGPSALRGRGKEKDDELMMGVTCMRCDWMAAEHFAPSLVRRTE